MLPSSGGATRGSSLVGRPPSLLAKKKIDRRNDARLDPLLSLDLAAPHRRRPSPSPRPRPHRPSPALAAPRPRQPSPDPPPTRPCSPRRNSPTLISPRRNSQRRKSPPGQPPPATAPPRPDLPLRASGHRHALPAAKPRRPAASPCPSAAAPCLCFGRPALLRRPYPCSAALMDSDDVAYWLQKSQEDTP